MQKPHDPFEAGATLCAGATKTASHFSYGERKGALKMACQLVGCTERAPVVDLNGTRMAATHRTLLTLITCELGVKAYCATHNNPTPLNADTEAEWDTLAEFESVLHLAQGYTTVAQYETLLNGAYRVPMFLDLRTKFSLEGPMLVLQRPVPLLLATKPPRVEKLYADFSATGQTCWLRASEEVGRRCDISKLSDRDLASMGADPRLWSFKSLANHTELQQCAMEAATSSYFKFCEGARNFRNKQATTSDVAPDAHESKSALFSTSASHAADEEVGDTSMSGEEEGDGAAELRLLEELRKVKETKKLKRLWRRKYKFRADLNPEPDVIKDLMTVNLSPTFKEIFLEGDYADAVRWALTHVVDNLSEGFNERHIHVINQIMTPERTSLSDDHLEKLGVLRMNEAYMREMKDALSFVALRFTVYETDEIKMAATKISAAGSKAN